MENSKIMRINAIMEDPDSIMLVVEQKKIKFIHSCKKFGGTRTNPTTTVVGLIGQGARAFPIVIDLEKAVTSKEVLAPSDARIWACKDATELRELDNNTSTTPPSAASGARTRSKRGASTEETTPPSPPDVAGTAAAATGILKYMALLVLIPLPYLGITALEFVLSNRSNRSNQKCINELHRGPQGQRFQVRRCHEGSKTLSEVALCSSQRPC